MEEMMRRGPPSKGAQGAAGTVAGPLGGRREPTREEEAAAGKPAPATPAAGRSRAVHTAWWGAQARDQDEVRELEVNKMTVYPHFQSRAPLISALKKESDKKGLTHIQNSVLFFPSLFDLRLARCPIFPTELPRMLCTNSGPFFPVEPPGERGGSGVAVTEPLPPAGEAPHPPMGASRGPRLSTLCGWWARQASPCFVGVPHWTPEVTAHRLKRGVPRVPVTLSACRVALCSGAALPRAVPTPLSHRAPAELTHTGRSVIIERFGQFET